MTHAKQGSRYAKQGSKEWFQLRVGRITGSNVGAILGLNPYRTADDVLRAMVREYHGAPSEFSGNQATAYGSFHEDGAISEYTMETGNKVEPCGFFVHPEHDWLGASPDGLVGDDAVIECKAPYSLRDKNPPTFKTADEQPHYWAQMQIEMACSGRSLCHFWQWSQHGTRLEVLRIDYAWLADAIPHLREFYEQYLSELDNEDHLRERRHQLAGRKYQRLLDEYDACSEAAKVATDRQKQILAELEQASGGRDAEVCGRLFTRVVRKGSVSYSKVVKEHLPDLDLEPFRGKDSEYWRLS